jgi:hypothetical protein
VIDKSGKIRFEHEGAADLNIIQREIETLLGETTSANRTAGDLQLSSSRALMISPSARPAVT